MHVIGQASQPSLEPLPVPLFPAVARDGWRQRSRYDPVRPASAFRTAQVSRQVLDRAVHPLEEASADENVSMYDAFAPAMATDSTDICLMLGKVAQRPETRVAHRSPR